MVRLMRFVREVSTSNRYDFVEPSVRGAAQQAFERGIECILKCQIEVDGKPTAWCAEHDEQDFSPRPAQSFELASTSGSESVEIVRLLMSLDRPSPEVVAAVQRAVAWFDRVRLTGIRQVSEPDPLGPKGRNKVVVKDETAPPLWARFYELGTNRPLFADRDGVPKYDLAEIGYEPPQRLRVVDRGAAGAVGARLPGVEEETRDRGLAQSPRVAFHRVRCSASRARERV